MNRDEVMRQSGTIAKSGTREFFSKLSGDQQKDANLIGQFGVGFLFGIYRGRQGRSHDATRGRTCRSRRALGIGRWRRFSIEMLENTARGRQSPLHLRADQDDLLSGYKIRSIIHKYSDLHRPAHPDEEGRMEGRRPSRHRGGRNGEPGFGLVARSKNEIIRGRVQGVLQKHVRPRTTKTLCLTWAQWRRRRLA